MNIPLDKSSMVKKRILRRKSESGKFWDKAEKKNKKVISRVSSTPKKYIFPLDTDKNVAAFHFCAY